MTVHLVGLSGSLRADSYNTMLLRAVQHVLPAHAALTLVDLHDIAPYDEDTRPNGTGFPEPVAALRRIVHQADALVLTTPEYNHAPSGVLKNAIDWLSIDGDDGVYPMNWKWAAVMGASTGTFGPARGVEGLRTILAATNTYAVAYPDVLVNRAESKFDADGTLTDEGTRRFLRQLMANLVHLADNHRLSDGIPYAASGV